VPDPESPETHPIRPTRTEADGRLSAWSSLLRVHAALVPELERELVAAHRMPLSWYDVLLELNAAEQRRLRMSELGARVVLSRERVSRVVDELERAGLVGRERNPDDKRSVYAVLTPAGRDRLREAAPTYLAGIGRHFTAYLSEEEARHITDALQRVLDAAEQRQHGERPFTRTSDEVGRTGRSRSLPASRTR
jgi:DNA-binding MarR family transcriptional regulator